jgi:DNA polymerase III delta prime subunit
MYGQQYNNDINIALIDRHAEENKIIDILTNFENNKTNLLLKRGIYVYGSPGSGKTTFVNNILKKLGYDIIRYDAGDIRNKTVIEEIASKNMGDINVLHSFSKVRKRLIIVMDEIDGMNNGDKGGISALIKLIRPKKTKKQKKEGIANVPIICISNYHIDKKITELMKICENIEIKPPTDKEFTRLIELTMPELIATNLKEINDYIQNDLRKYKFLYKLYKNNVKKCKHFLQNRVLKNNLFNTNTKEITKNLINNFYMVNEHTALLKDTDRTIVSLLWHENIIGVVDSLKHRESISAYSQVLENICFSDYIDRITFQKQIWQLNEISSIIKLITNNQIIHPIIKGKQLNINSIRFTKILTKYSTEYNNIQFIAQICQQLNKDKKDVLVLFILLRASITLEQIYEKLESYDVTKLDINRLYRYIDRTYYNVCNNLQ